MLALLAIVGGIVAIPKTTSWLDHFLAPTFADSTLVSHPSERRCSRSAWSSARVVGLGGIAHRLLRLGRAARRSRRRSRARFAPLASLFEHKWYFDELIDALVVRPGAWFGRFAQNTFERRRRQRRADRRHDRARARRLGARARGPERAPARLRRR